MIETMYQQSEVTMQAMSPEALIAIRNPDIVHQVILYVEEQTIDEVKSVDNLLLSMSEDDLETMSQKSVIHLQEFQVIRVLVLDLDMKRSTASTGLIEDVLEKTIPVWSAVIVQDLVMMRTMSR